MPKKTVTDEYYIASWGKDPDQMQAEIDQLRQFISRVVTIQDDPKLTDHGVSFRIARLVEEMKTALDWLN